MKRFILLICALFVLSGYTLASCTPPQTSTNYKTADGKLVHWRQNVPGSQERVIQVYVPATQASDGSFMHAVNHAVEQANRSPYIRMVINVPSAFPSACPSNCVKVLKADLAYPYVGITGTGWDSQGHMYGFASTVRVDLAGMTQQQKDNTLTHELGGHANGLGHPCCDRTGPSVNGVLTDWDLSLIKKAHAHWDGITQSTTQLSPDVVAKDTKAEAA